MTYYSHTNKELEELGIQEDELAIYTGTLNPRKADSLTPDSYSRNAYVHIWENGQERELDAIFSKDSEGLDVLEVRTGEEEYAFLRDKDSGYIRQVSGHAKPITLANIGAIPLRADTFLGKFTVHAGSALRLDENAPRREKKKVLLAVTSDCRRPQFIQPVEYAAIWDGISWRRLNIREEPTDAHENKRAVVLDGNAIVQQLEVNRKQEILMPDSPEPDPDYEIYVTTQGWNEATLCFNRSDYRDGRVVQRKRTIAYGIVSAPGVYDLQKLKETQTQRAIHLCTAELPGAPDIFELPALTAKLPSPDDRAEAPAQRKKLQLRTDQLREFLKSEEKPGEQPLASEKALIPEPPENFPE